MAHTYRTAAGLFCAITIREKGTNLMLTLLKQSKKLLQEIGYLHFVKLVLLLFFFI